jgi:hypothetical protein
VLQYLTIVVNAITQVATEDITIGANGSSRRGDKGRAVVFVYASPPSR